MALSCADALSVYLANAFIARYETNATVSSSSSCAWFTSAPHGWFGVIMLRSTTPVVASQSVTFAPERHDADMGAQNASRPCAH